MATKTSAKQPDFDRSGIEEVKSELKKGEKEMDKTGNQIPTGVNVNEPNTVEGPESGLLRDIDPGVKRMEDAYLAAVGTAEDDPRDELGRIPPDKEVPGWLLDTMSDAEIRAVAFDRGYEIKSLGKLAGRREFEEQQRKYAGKSSKNADEDEETSLLPRT